jgi:hypothetical protein
MRITFWGGRLSKVSPFRVVRRSRLKFMSRTTAPHVSPGDREYHIQEWVRIGCIPSLTTRSEKQRGLVVLIQ